MGLRNIFQKAALSAVQAIGDIPETITMTQATSKEYDPATGTFVESVPATCTFSAPVVGYDQSEVDGRSIRETDQKILAPGLSLTFEPVSGDTATRNTTEKWTVVYVKKDPASALYEIQIRK